MVIIRFEIFNMRSDVTVNFYTVSILTSRFTHSDTITVVDDLTVNEINRFIDLTFQIITISDLFTE